MNPFLEFRLEGLDAPVTLEIPDAMTEAVIGRASDCALVLQSGSVSRRHARITRAGTELTIEDLGSSNGTFVNGARLGAPRVLVDGDEVKLGSITGRFVQPPPAAGDATIAIPPEGGATILVSSSSAAAERPEEPPPASPPPASAADPSITTRTSGTATTQLPETPPEAPVESRTAPPVEPPAAPRAVEPPAPAPRRASIPPAPGGGPSIAELVAIAAGSFLVVFAVGALAIRFLF